MAHIVETLRTHPLATDFLLPYSDAEYDRIIGYKMDLYTMMKS